MLSLVHNIAGHFKYESLNSQNTVVAAAVFYFISMNYILIKIKLINCKPLKNKIITRIPCRIIIIVAKKSKTIHCTKISHAVLNARKSHVSSCFGFRESSFKINFYLLFV